MSTLSKSCQKPGRFLCGHKITQKALLPVQHHQLHCSHLFKLSSRQNSCLRPTAEEAVETCVQFSTTEQILLPERECTENPPQSGSRYYTATSKVYSELVAKLFLADGFSGLPSVRAFTKLHQEQAGARTLIVYKLLRYCNRGHPKQAAALCLFISVFSGSMHTWTHEGNILPQH